MVVKRIQSRKWGSISLRSLDDYSSYFPSILFDPIHFSRLRYVLIFIIKEKCMEDKICLYWRQRINGLEGLSDRWVLFTAEFVELRSHLNHYEILSSFLSHILWKFRVLSLISGNPQGLMFSWPQLAPLLIFLFPRLRKLGPFAWLSYWAQMSPLWSFGEMSHANNLKLSIRHSLKKNL